jgi:hypothetical protein
MTGFKNFILRGNLVELAVAFIMGLGPAGRARTRGRRPRGGRRPGRDRLRTRDGLAPQRSDRLPGLLEPRPR